MAADPRLQDVLRFLTSRGFNRAAEALRDDALARGAGLVDLYLDGSRPPPIRTAPEQRGTASSGSSSDDAFATFGSASSEFLNPCALWSPAGAQSEDSSARPSEFETARDYHDPNLFDDSQWYDDHFEYYLNDSHFFASSSAGDPGDDKFIMSIEADKQFRRENDFVGQHERGMVAGCVGCSESYNCSFDICNCCNISYHNGEPVKDLNSSIYERYLIMDDQTERLEEFGAIGHQLKQTGGALEVVPIDGAVQDPKFAVEGRSLEPESGNASVENEVASLKYILKEGFLAEVDREDFQREDELKGRAFQIGKHNAYASSQHGTITKESQVPGDEEHGTNDKLQVHNSAEEEYEVFHLRIIHRKNRTGFEENKDLPIVLNSVIGGRYYVTEYLGSAAFSKVVQAYDLQTGVNVCLKIIKNDKDFFDQSLDEIKLLKYVNKNDPADEHHILRLYDYFYHQEHLFIVCELLQANLYEFQKYSQESGAEVYFTLRRIQVIARQCLEALEYLHHLGIIHCDLKPENILLKSYNRCQIKVIDLGSSCFQTDNLCLYVQSRSYRAPEVILGLSYDPKIDLWSLGCILAELYSGDVLFPNDSLAMILARMIGILGPIDEEMLAMGVETPKYFTDDYDLYYRDEETDQIEYLIPEKSSLATELQVSDILFLDFLEHLLQMNPQKRPTATQALHHPWLSFSYK